MGTPTWDSPLHYDSGPAPGIHADVNFNPGVGQVHTIFSIVVTKDAGSPYNHMNIRHTNGTEWVSPVIPVGTTTLTQAQINGQGFTVMEDIGSYTASP